MVTSYERHGTSELETGLCTGSFQMPNPRLIKVSVMPWSNGSINTAPTKMLPVKPINPGRFTGAATDLASTEMNNND